MDTCLDHSENIETWPCYSEDMDLESETSLPVYPDDYQVYTPEYSPVRSVDIFGSPDSKLSWNKDDPSAQDKD
jgi:hypothetical protein